MGAVLQLRKVCGGCERDLPTTSQYFCRNAQGKHGLHSVCRECRDKRGREDKATFRSDHPEEARVQGREEQRQRRLRKGITPRAERREQVLISKTKLCSKCGTEKRKNAFPSGNCVDGRGSWCRSCVARSHVDRRDAQAWQSRLLCHARERHLKMGFSVQTFDLSVELLNRMLSDQDGRCGWFKVPLTLTRKSGPTQVSLDRADNDRGYTADNVLLVCKAANLARNSDSEVEFEVFVDTLVDSIKLRRI